MPRVLRNLSMRHQSPLRGWCLDIEWSGCRDQHSRLNPAGSKISDSVRYLATLLIAPASVIDLFFLQKARTFAVFVSRRLKSRVSLLAAAL